MADTSFRGPVNAPGPLLVQAGTTATVETMDGPSMFFQNTGWPDPRAVPYPSVSFRPGQAPAFISNCDILAVDAVPQATNTNVLAAGQIITSGLAMALATVGVTNFSSGAASIAVGVTIIPQGTTVATTVVALDFGFTSGTTVANSSTVQVADNTLFELNQWIIIGNVGNAAGTRSLITQVQSISTTNTTTITVAPSPATALGAPIGQANLFGSGLLPPATQFGPAAASASAHSLGGSMRAGFSRIMNPRETLCRNIGLAMLTGAAATATAIVTGFDLWGAAMSELITINASTGVTTAWGKKAFKYVSAVTPGTNVATATLQVGIGDVFGMPFRADEVQLLDAWAGNTAIQNNVGFSAALFNTPSSNTTGDVRGTLQLSGNGPGTVISSPATTNNVLRFMVIQNIGVWNTVFTTPNNLAPMFGTTQV